MLQQAILEVVGMSHIVGAIRAVENVHPESHDTGRYTNRGAAANARSLFDRPVLSEVEGLRVSGSEYVAMIMPVGTKVARA